MARPSILGNDPPTEAEVNHALECCKAVPRIREELLAMEQEKQIVSFAVLPFIHATRSGVPKTGTGRTLPRC